MKTRTELIAAARRLWPGDRCAMKSRTELVAMARRLWPGDRRLQAAWLRAVRRVRRTTGGWVLDRGKGVA